MKKEVKLGRRKMLAAGAASLAGLAAFGKPATAAASKHPRLDKAIVDMEDALLYLRAAPHMFGGHKKAAIQHLEAGVAELKLARTF